MYEPITPDNFREKIQDVSELSKSLEPIDMYNLPEGAKMYPNGITSANKVKLLYKWKDKEWKVLRSYPRLYAEYELNKLRRLYSFEYEFKLIDVIKYPKDESGLQKGIIITK